MKKTTIDTAWVRRAAWIGLVFLAGLFFSACSEAEIFGGARPEPEPIDPTYFISKWMVSPGGSIQLPLADGGDYDFTVDWGDGTTGKISSWDDVKAKHTYTTSGEYTVTITGTFEGFRFLKDPAAAPGSEDYGDAQKLIDIVQWGKMALGAVDRHFMGASNLGVITASDVPDLSKTTSLKSSFEGASKFNGDLSSWDTSAITDMSYMFRGATAFNQDLSSWDVSGVSAYYGVFTDSNTQPENQPQKFRAFISKWKTDNSGGNGRSGDTQARLPLVLEGNYDFRVDWGDGSHSIITEWDAGEATHDYGTAGTYTVKITGLFEGWRFMVDPDDTSLGYRDSKKLLDILQWGGMVLGAIDSHFAYTDVIDFTASDVPDLSKTTSLRQTFGFSNFNGNINNWDVSQVTNMASMFEASTFNGGISEWDVSSVITMESMFSSAFAFNQDIGEWDVSSVITMESMFSSAFAFNQDIGEWDVEKVTGMNRMFQEARAFDQDISGWIVDQVLDYGGIFGNSAIRAEYKPPRFR